jgi:outer membrane protein OmpA-like peptidoglycan-associated protein
MKKKLILLFIGLAGMAGAVQAQNHGIGIHFGGYDFYGPQTNKHFRSDRYIYTYNTETRKYDSSTEKRFYYRPMVKVSYWYQLNRAMDVNMHLSLASLEYPNSDDDTVFTRKYLYNETGNRRERFLGEFDVRFNYSILPRDKWLVSPYVFAGLYASYHDVYFGAGIPLGLGLNINLTKDRALSLNLESAYKIAVTSHDADHLQHSVGFVYWFKPGYRVPASGGSTQETAALAPPADSDNDGINDTEDQCPTIAGTAQFNGCPDSDNDGISDRDDACPLVAGMAQFNGCPDTDGDGIADNTDKCPYLAGTADRQGCPVPDKDNDGFNDDEDRCPEVYSKTNMGCPEIRREIITQVEKAAKAIFFETAKSTIKPISFKSLDAVVRILKADPTLYADIEGHTDNVGDDAYNMTLSQERAESVRAYFVSKGVDANRLTSQGFGETQPVATNESAAGKAQNRRTVIKLRNYAK